MHKSLLLSYLSQCRILGFSCGKMNFVAIVEMASFPNIACVIKKGTIFLPLWLKRRFHLIDYNAIIGLTWNWCKLYQILIQNMKEVIHCVNQIERALHKTDNQRSASVLPERYSSMNNITLQSKTCKNKIRWNHTYLSLLLSKQINLLLSLWFIYYHTVCAIFSSNIYINRFEMFII